MGASPSKSRIGRMQRLRNRASLFHAHAQRFNAIPVVSRGAPGLQSSSRIMAPMAHFNPVRCWPMLSCKSRLMRRRSSSCARITRPKDSRRLFHALAFGDIHHHPGELVAARRKRDLLHVKVKPARVSIRLNHARVKLLLPSIAGRQRAALPHQLPIVGMRVLPEKVRSRSATARSKNREYRAPLWSPA